MKVEGSSAIFPVRENSAMTLSEFAQKVRSQRKSAGLTQAEAAALCGVGTRFLSELENGKHSLHIGKVLQVLAGLGLTCHIQPRGQR